MLQVIGGVVVVGAVIAGISYVAYLGASFYAPKYEAIRRDQMIQSRSYTEGSIRTLYNLKRQYEQAKTNEERGLIAATARHEFSIFPQERLPTELKVFMVTVGD
jgi:hypothetical protein